MDTSLLVRNTAQVSCSNDPVGCVTTVAVQGRSDSDLRTAVTTEPWHPDRLRDRRGAGLWLVDAAATAWGAMPWDGGKPVRATLVLDGRAAP